MKVRKGGGEEIPLLQGKEQRLRFAGAAIEEIPHAPKPKARGGGQEEQPHVQRTVAARAQEGLEELSYVESQEGWR